MFAGVYDGSAGPSDHTLQDTSRTICTRVHKPTRNVAIRGRKKENNNNNNNKNKRG